MCNASRHGFGIRSTGCALSGLDIHRLFAGFDQRHATGAFAGLVADHLAATRPASTHILPGKFGGFGLAIEFVGRHLVLDPGHGDLDQVMAAAAFPGFQRYDVAVAGVAGTYIEGVTGLDR